MKISACVITKDEEKNIIKCIESLKSFADEVIVVDTGSTDNTVKILKGLNIQLYYCNWDNNFSNAKNYALSKVTGDWIVFIDADEYISLNKKDLIDTLMNAEKQEMKASLCKWINLDEEKVIGESNIIRIFKNEEGIKYEGKIHESITYDGKIDKISENILKIYHTGYSKNIIVHKFKRNYEILIQELRENSNNPKIFYYLSDCCLGLKKYELSIFYAKKFIESGYNALERNITPYKNIITSMIQLHLYYKNIIEFINDTLVKFPYHPELYRYLGNVYFDNKDFINALKCYEEAIGLNENYDSLEENLFVSYLGEIYYKIAIINSLKGDENKAFHYYKLALKEDRYNIKYFLKFTNTLKNQPYEKYISYLDEIYDYSRDKDIEFLIQNLSSLKLNEPLNYFFNLWQNPDKYNDATYILLNILNGKAYEVADVLIKISEASKSVQLPKILMLSLLQCMNKNLYYKSKELSLDSTYEKILDSLLLDKNVEFNDKDINSYIDILQELIFIKSSSIDCYVNLREKFKNTNKVNEIIGDTFLNNNFYEDALKFYRYCIKNSYNMENINNKLGRVYYYLKSYDCFLNSSEKSIEAGYFTKDISSYLQWCSENGGNINEIKEKLSLFPTRLNIGCGKNIKNAWINLDITYIDGIDVIADLDKCKTTKLPFEENSIDEFYASHVIEHIENVLPMMEELYRVAKKDAKAIFKCPYGSSDDAFEDPTHVKRYFLNSFGYFSQPFYWRADYGYKGDWKAVKIVLYVSKDKYTNLEIKEIFSEINTFRNVVIEMEVELIAVKPARKQLRELQEQPKIEIKFV